MNRIERINNILEQNLNPSHLVIEDDSAKHAGHRENKGGEFTHLNISIQADFGDRTILQSHRLIKDMIREEFEQGLHAISIKII